MDINDEYKWWTNKRQMQHQQQFQQMQTSWARNNELNGLECKHKEDGMR